MTRLSTLGTHIIGGAGEKPKVHFRFPDRTTHPKDRKNLQGDRWIAPDNLIAWIDIMGFSSTLHRSISAAGNFMFKMHAIVIDEFVYFLHSKNYKRQKSPINLYPVMDGIYVTCATDKYTDFAEFLSIVMARLCVLFLDSGESHDANRNHQFIVKGSIAKGPALHGRDLNVSNFLENPRKGTAPRGNLAAHDNLKYKESLLVSYAMADSNKNEPKAPPFGFFVHDSARDFLSDITNRNTADSSYWWYWFRSGGLQSDSIAETMREALDQYFKSVEVKGEAIGYSAESMKRHRSQMKAYFWTPEKLLPTAQLNDQ